MFETAQMPISKWVDQKTVVHLCYGILCSIKKGGSPTFYNGLDRTGDYDSKWNKSVGKRQIPYDVTYSCYLMNKIN